MQFIRLAAGSQVFVADGLVSGGAWAGLVVPDASQPGGSTFALTDVLANAKALASIVVSPSAPDLSAAGVVALVARVQAALKRNNNPQGILWLRPANGSAPPLTPLLPFTVSGGATTSGYLAPNSLTWSLSALRIGISNNLSLSAGPSGLTLTGSKAVFFVQPNLSIYAPVTTAALVLTGPSAGQLSFDITLFRSDLIDGLYTGLQFLIQTGTQENPQTPGWYPLFDRAKPNPSDGISFHATIDYGDPTNVTAPARTAFWFKRGSVLQSYYRTDTGQRLELMPVTGDDKVAGALPSYLELVEGLHDNQGAELFQFSPVGDFSMRLAGTTTPTRCRMLCGLGGTEAIDLLAGAAVGAGDRLRFVSRQPAYVPVWPPVSPTPLDPPVAANVVPLVPGFQTSWATVIAADPQTPARYAAQPQGAPLYTVGAAAKGPPVLQPLFAARPWPCGPGFCAPLAPYVGVSSGDGATRMTTGQMADLECLVLAPYRGALVRAGSPGISPAAVGGGNAAKPAATTAGVIVQALPDGSYADILLGRTDSPKTGPAGGLALRFAAPGDTLQKVFHDASLFLVAANAVQLGALVDFDTQLKGKTPPLTTTAFWNALSVGDWVLQADVGTNPGYGDYRNVLIVKSRPGRLIDLVAKAGAWTDPVDFAAPTIQRPDGSLVPPDPSQVANLSQWLVDFIQAGIDQANAEDSTAGDSVFDNFAALAQDPAWTGVIVLRATVAQFPTDLAGIIAGVDANRFEAHHFGVRLSPVDGASIAIAGDSSVFGLINYKDAAYAPPPGQTQTPVPLVVNDDYGFLVLSLQVLFENTAVKRFSSLAQLTVGRLFGVPVKGMVDGGAYTANPYNAILFDGAYQNVGGVASYSLATQVPFGFQMDSPVLSRVAVVSAALNTVSVTEDQGHSAGKSVFSLAGLLDFAALSDNAKPAQPFDLFSFGADAPGGPVAGLAFSRLALPMAYDEKPPASRTITFDASAIVFDAANSHSRKGSLYQDFGPKVDGLVVAAAGVGLDGRGFEPVILVGAQLDGQGSNGWYGLSLKLDFGTPGKLAGKLGLASHLVLAWGPGGSGGIDAGAGIALPGMGSGGTLSLQSVLKLGVGRVLLSRPAAATPRFLLTLSDIALKALGILKLPPNGTADFLLFGAPAATTDPGSLGWLALYNQGKAKSASTALADTKALPKGPL